MEQVPGKLSEMLPPEPASVRRARHLVASAITASRHDELVETATLLVSEVVTNSVLHAGTEIRLKCRADRTGVRVEVFDRSPLSPSVRHYDAEAMTGRGLALVSVLATAWGVDLEGDGKTVWFELGTVEAEDEAPTPAVAAEAAQNPAPTLEIRLPAASPPLVKATIEHGDALLRELALLALGGELDDALADGWQLPQFDVSPILAAVESAGAQAKADLEVHFPAGAHATATERLRLIERADTLAREGRLFTAPALPEVAVCRHWLYTQIAEQAAGFPSAGWELPEPLKPARVAARLPAKELERLKEATAATVVADDANRIIFVNEGGRRASRLGAGGAGRPAPHCTHPTRATRGTPRRVQPAPSHRRAPHPRFGSAGARAASRRVQRCGRPVDRAARRSRRTTRLSRRSHSGDQGQQGPWPDPLNLVHL